MCGFLFGKFGYNECELRICELFLFMSFNRLALPMSHQSPFTLTHRHIFLISQPLIIGQSQFRKRNLQTERRERFSPNAEACLRKGLWPSGQVLCTLRRRRRVVIKKSGHCPLFFGYSGECITYPRLPTTCYLINMSY